jgi:hypothetical protein
VQALRWPTLGTRLVFFLPMLAPLFPAHLQVTWLVVAVTATAIPQGVANVLFMDMLRKSVPNPNSLTVLLARRLLFFNIMVAAGTLGFGLWLEAGPFPVNYMLMFAVAFGAALMSYHVVMKVRIPDTVHVPRKSRVKVRPLGSKPFRKVLLVAFTTHVAVTSIAAVIPLQLVQELGAGESYMAVYGMVELGAAALISLVGARAAQKLGSQGLIAVGMMGTAIAAVLIASSTNLTVLLLSAGLMGASWTLAAGIGLFRYFSDTSPAGEGSVEYTTMYNQSMGIAMFVGPMLGSALVTGGMSLVGVLLVGAVLRLGSALLVRAPMRRRQAAPAPALQVQQEL